MFQVHDVQVQALTFFRSVEATKLRFFGTHGKVHSVNVQKYTNFLTVNVIFSLKFNSNVHLKNCGNFSILSTPSKYLHVNTNFLFPTDSLLIIQPSSNEGELYPLHGLLFPIFYTIQQQGICLVLQKNLVKVARINEYVPIYFRYFDCVSPDCKWMVNIKG